MSDLRPLDKGVEKIINETLCTIAYAIGNIPHFSEKLAFIAITDAEYNVSDLCLDGFDMTEQLNGINTLKMYYFKRYGKDFME